MDSKKINFNICIRFLWIKIVVGKLYKFWIRSSRSEEESGKPKQGRQLQINAKQNYRRHCVQWREMWNTWTLSKINNGARNDLRAWIIMGFAGAMPELQRGPHLYSCAGVRHRRWLLSFTGPLTFLKGWVRLGESKRKLGWFAGLAKVWRSFIPNLLRHHCDLHNCY